LELFIKDYSKKEKETVKEFGNRILNKFMIVMKEFIKMIKKMDMVSILGQMDNTTKVNSRKI
jgi:hypothetical protein